jgi:hypothetical protein
MREPYIEGVATHDDPESCVGAREGNGEARPGARVRRVMSREITEFGEPMPSQEAEGNATGTAIARCWSSPRGLRPLACAESSCARTERSLRRSRSMARPRAASERPEAMRR